MAGQMRMFWVEPVDLVGVGVAAQAWAAQFLRATATSPFATAYLKITLWLLAQAQVLDKLWQQASST
jgi:hypothetical protein